MSEGHSCSTDQRNLDIIKNATAGKRSAGPHHIVNAVAMIATARHSIPIAESFPLKVLIGGSIPLLILAPHWIQVVSDEARV